MRERKIDDYAQSEKREYRMINRDDMLELTRRMTVSRTCFSRLAGGYLDEEGFLDGTFNIHFLKLSASDQTKNLALAKAVPFAGTNEELREFHFAQGAQVQKLLYALQQAELKEDGILEVFYEEMGKHVRINSSYGIYVFYGSYDVPRMGKDKVSQGESEEVYRFIICAIAPVDRNYEPLETIFGFLYPALKDRHADLDHIDLFSTDPVRDQMLMNWILGKGE